MIDPKLVSDSIKAAQDEVARLRAENERLREALEDMDEAGITALGRGELIFGVTENGRVYVRMAHVPGNFFGMGDTIHDAIADATERRWQPTAFVDEEAPDDA